MPFISSGALTKPLSLSIYFLGALLIVLGLVLPWYLSQQTAPSSVASSQPPSNPPAQFCGVSTSTFTSGNATHRALNVTCGETMTFSAQAVRIYGPGPQSLSLAQSSIFTTLSIVSSVGVAAIAIVLQGDFRALGHLVLVPAICALWLLSLAIAVAVYDSLLGPLSGLQPSIFLVELSFAMTLWGLGASMIALAGALRKGQF